eukprot:311715_1
MESNSGILEIYNNFVGSNSKRKSHHAISLIFNKLSNSNTSTVSIIDLATVESFIPQLLISLHHTNTQNQLKAIECMNLIVYVSTKNHIKWTPGYNLIHHILVTLKESNSRTVTQQIASLLKTLIHSYSKCTRIIFKVNGFELISQKIMHLSRRKKKNSYYDIDIIELMQLFPLLLTNKHIKIHRYWKYFESTLYSFITLWKDKLQVNIAELKKHILPFHRERPSNKCCCGCILIPKCKVFYCFINFMANLNCQSHKTFKYNYNYYQYMQHIISAKFPKLIYKYLLLAIDCSFGDHLKDQLILIEASCVQFLQTFCAETRFNQSFFQQQKRLHFDNSLLLKVTKVVFDDHDDRWMHSQECESCNHDECKRFHDHSDPEINRAQGYANDIKFRTQKLLHYVFYSNCIKNSKCIDLLLTYDNGKLISKIIDHYCETMSSFELIVFVMKFATAKQFTKLLSNHAQLIKIMPVIEMIRIRSEIENWERWIEWNDCNNEYSEMCTHLISFIQIRKAIDCVEFNQMYNKMVLEMFPFFGLYDDDQLFVLNERRKELKVKFKSIVCAYKQCEWRDNKMVKIKLCSGCKLVYYCCVNHQKKDWKYGGHRFLCQILQFGDITMSPLLRLSNSLQS